MRILVFGPGGFDESKPNNNIIDTIDVPDPVLEDDAPTVLPVDAP